MHASAGRRVAVAAFLLLAATALPAGGPRAQDGVAGEQAYGDYLQGLHLFHGGEYEAALPYFVRAKDEAAARAGHGSGEHATALNNLGELYRRMGRLDEAEALLRQALAIEERRLGPTDRQLAKPLNNLALVQRAQGRYDEAEANLKRSLRLLEDALGYRHPDVAGSLNNLARLYESTGRPDDARPLLERALMIAVDTLGDAHPTTKRVAVNLERVKGQSAGNGTAAADEPAAVLAAAGDAPAPVAAQAGPPATALLPPPDADLPEPAALPVPTVPAADVATAGPVGERPRARPQPAEDTLLAEAPAADVEAATIEAPTEPAPRTASEAALGAAPVAAFGAESDVAALGEANGAAADGYLLPRARPAGWRWPHLPPNAYALHLASVRSPVSATSEWQRLAQLLELPPAIHQIEPQRIETADEGVFYRVMGGPFASAAEALAACRPIRARGEYCGIIGNDD